jgi:hypothetical protein
MDGVCRTHAIDERNLCKISVGKPEAKRQSERTMCKWKYSDKMNLREIG